MEELERNYYRVHSWLIYWHGRAVKCENEKCTFENPKRFEWALLKGKEYEKNRDNFTQFCCSCHRKYDITDEARIKMSNSRKGVIPVNTRKVILNDKQVFISMADGARETGISVSAIHQNLRGRTHKTVVGVWKDYQEN